MTESTFDSYKDQDDKWWEDYDNVIAMVKYLADDLDVEEIVDFVEKPWRYSQEYKEMREESAVNE